MLSMLKSQGELGAFFERPVAGVLGTVTVILWALLMVRAVRQLLRPAAQKES